MSEVDKTPAQPTSNQCSDCGAGPDDPCGRPYYGPGRCPVGKTPSIENMVQAARASAIDLRRRACPTAADSVEAIAQKAERLHAALTECVKMLTGLVEHRDDAGLISVYPDPYGALNDARETLGLSRLSWNSPEEIQQDIRRSAHETSDDVIGNYEAWIAEVFGDTEFCTDCVDKLAEHLKRKPTPPGSPVNGPAESGKP